MPVLQRSFADMAALQSALQAAELPVDDLDEPGREFFQFQLDGDLVGFGGIERYANSVLLRSVVVAPDHRGQGVGREIAESLLHEAQAGGADEVYLLTTTAAPFFEALGFTVIDRADAPTAILGTRQAATICSTAALLRRSTAS